MVKRKHQTIQIPIQGYQISCLFSYPKDKETYPLVLYFHGGGFSMGSGSLIQSTPIGRALHKFKFVLLSPSYTLMKGPGTGYPRQFDECYATLEYALSHAEELCIDKDRIIIAGDSAGGNLAVAVTYKAIDNGIKIHAHIPLYPMLSAKETSMNFTVKAHFWDGKRNKAAWETYLSNIQGETPDYASPSLRINLKGMPPCYTFISDQEPFYEETMAYIARLKETGVEATVDIFHSSFHSFDCFYPFTKNARKAMHAYYVRLSDFLSR